MKIHVLVVLCAFLSACDDGTAATTDPCPKGICGSGGSSSTSSTGGSGGCVEAWTCTPWVAGDDGMYSRTCTDASACGTELSKPPEGPIALPDLDMEYYKCNVEPIFDRSCSMLGCHGAEKGRAFKVYARGRLRNDEVVSQVPSCPIGPQTINLADEGTGTVMCIGWSPHTQAEWEANYNNARSFMVGLDDPEASELLTQPKVGGKAHAGVHLFAKGDADYEAISSWLGGAKLGQACDTGAN